MSEQPIYLDAHATTPVDPRVRESMLPYFTEEFGNAASRNHAFGWRAEEAVDAARERVAAAIGASPREIVFTSGATESDNLAVLGVAEANRDRGDHVIASAVEHPAVLECCRALEKRGFRIALVPVDGLGLLDLDALRDALEERTVLVSVMTANNEVGTIQPITEIVDLVRGHSSAVFHTDAAQAVGYLPIDVEADRIDLLSLSGHKIYGPKGVGALRVRRRPRIRIQPRLLGGGHERGLRSGTLNVPGIVGLGMAAEIATSEREAERARLARLRDSLQAELLAKLRDVHVNGHPGRRLPNNLNVSFSGVEAEDLLREIPQIAVSTGAACSSASPEPSHVIEALGLGSARAQSSIRFGLGRFTTPEEIERCAAAVIGAVRKLRATSSVGGDV